VRGSAVAAVVETVVRRIEVETVAGRREGVAVRRLEDRGDALAGGWSSTASSRASQGDQGQHADAFTTIQPSSCLTRRRCLATSHCWSRLMIVRRSDREQTVWDGNTYKRCFRPGRIRGADLMWLPTFPALAYLAAFIVNSRGGHGDRAGRDHHGRAVPASRRAVSRTGQHGEVGRRCSPPIVVMPVEITPAMVGISGADWCGRRWCWCADAARCWC